jgi:hypothetical protein
MSRRLTPAILAPLIGIAAVLAAAMACRAGAPVDRTVDFRAEIYPLLERHCFACHRGPDPKSGHRLDLRAEILGENDGEPLAVAGKSGASRLVAVVAGLDPDVVMPPPQKKDRLSEAEVGLLRAWIDQGLAWDDALLPPDQDRSTHWAFQPVGRPEIPSIGRDRCVRTPVDAFVAAEQAARGLAAAPEADRRVLIRRLSFDLTGLPPAPEAIRAFLADRAPDAYERLVDRLLASPQYGERWARHWLDVARWSESEGYENNALRPFAWRYRDYVVKSFNADTPYDVFVRQQVAGDERLPRSDEDLIATGFLAAARFSGNEEDKEKQRSDVLVDIVGATSSALLGLTLGCAQCHNHKFDPITQRDYYRFQGFFIRGQMNNLVLKDPALWAEYEAAIPPALAPAEQLRLALEGQAKAVLKEEPGKALTPEAIEKALKDEDKELYSALRKKLAALKKQMPPKPQTIGFYSPATSSAPVEVIALESNFPLPYRPDELKQARPYLLIRGDVHQRGPELGAGWPAVFGPTPTETSTRGSRSALADWLTDPANPLTARVWANRVWAAHFGRGLVETPNDFGIKGARPTHPQLLDFLAGELVRSGWSTKHLHRLIVNSATYRQAARGPEASTQADPENFYLGHWSPGRLETEAIRDAILAASGELAATTGGPSTPLAALKDRKNGRPMETETRLVRSLYLQQRRGILPPMQALFDGPTANESCARRHTSTVALQPLFLLNSDFMRNRARAMAARVAGQAGGDRGAWVEIAFERALGRLPDAEERRLCLALLEPEPAAEAVPESLVRLCHMIFNLNEFIYIE